MRKDGYALIELVVSIMLYALILILFATVVVAFSRMYELAAKLDDVTSEAEEICRVVGSGYKAADSVVIENNELILDGVRYYFDTSSRTFFQGNKPIASHKDLTNFMIRYDKGNIINCVEFSIIYYKTGILNELYFKLANFKGDL